MNDLYKLGSELRDVLRGLISSDVVRAGTLEMSGINESDATEVIARQRRRDPKLVPGSRHFAATLAYGDFIMANGPTIRCEAIPGVSGVITSPTAEKLDTGQSKVQLTRILTHFDFAEPEVLIEQNLSKVSNGVLIGAQKGEVGSLLPGKASFSQYLILVLKGRPLANREPLVMTADRVDEWPPIGSTFVSESPTVFFDLGEVDKPNANAVATLTKCSNTVVSELVVPQV